MGKCDNFLSLRQSLVECSFFKFEEQTVLLLFWLLKRYIVYKIRYSLLINNAQCMAAFITNRNINKELLRILPNPRKNMCFIIEL